jgi:hypothetical protein
MVLCWRCIDSASATAADSPRSAPTS